MDDFSKYEALRDAGASPKDVYRIAKADGFDAITLLRLLKKVFALSLPQAKEVTLIAEHTANSLDEFQEKLVSGLEQVFARGEPDRSVNGAPIESAERTQGPCTEPFTPR